METIIDEEISQILYEKINNSKLNVFDSSRFEKEINKKEKYI